MPKRVHRKNHVPPHKPIEKKPSELSGKKVEEKKAFFDTTTGKVVAVAGIALLALSFGLGIYLYSGSPEEANEENSQKSSKMDPQPYLSGQGPSLHPVHLTKFEPYVAQFVHNGFYSIKNGDTDISCRILSNLDELDKCARYADLYFPYYQGASKSEKQAAYHSDGYALVDENGVMLRLGLNPWFLDNWKNALKTVELTLLSPVLEDLDIEKVILDIHANLTYQLKNLDGTEVKSGDYRTRPVAIQPDGLADDMIKLRDFVEKKNGPGSFETLQRAAQSFQKFDGIHRLSRKEKKVFTSVYKLCSPAKDLHQEMKQFSKEYADKIRKMEAKQKKTRDEVFELAAWVHMSLVKIHPFEDGNGRLARILMNTELKRCGYHSVVFLNDKEYTKAIDEDRQQPGAFAAYIEQVYDTIPETMNGDGLLQAMQKV